MKRTLLALAVVALLVGIYFIGTNGSFFGIGGYEDGTPEPEVTIIITERNSGESSTGTIDPMKLSTPLTTISSTLYAINPDSYYYVEFSVAYRINPPAGSEGMQFKGYSSMTGVLPSDATHAQMYFAHKGTNPVVNSHVVATPSLPLVQYTGYSNFSRADGSDFDVYNYGDSGQYATWQQIRGADLGGSVWTLNCYAQSTVAGTGGYSGTTTVTINMSLGGNNLVVTVDGVAVTVTTP